MSISLMIIYGERTRCAVATETIHERNMIACGKLLSLGGLLMPKAYECSRCGELNKGAPSVQLEAKKNLIALDLCPRCHERLQGWLDGMRSTEISTYNEEKNV